MEYPVVLVIAFVLAIIIGICIAYVNSPRIIGRIGEAEVRQVLSRLPAEYKVLNDVVLKTKSGTTQIDHIVVSKFGVFAIETKNYRGQIYGDDDRQEWKQIIVTEVTYRRKWWKEYTYVTKNMLYNPVKQCLGHAYEIKRLCPEVTYLQVKPIVVFTGRADLSGVRSQYDVIDISYLLSLIESYQDIKISDASVKLIYNRLVECNVRDTVSDKEHIKNVRRAAQTTDSMIESGICPRCGGRLVYREGRYGSFIGCSNYPRCRFTMKD